MLRLMGAVLLMIAGVWLGLSIRRAERMRISMYSASAALIRHARRKIDLFETPICDLFSDFTEGFDARTRRDLSEKPLEVALAPIVKTLGVDGIVLERFAREIGSGYKTDAIRLCDYCLSVMEDGHAAAVSRYTSHKRLYIVLPLLLAVSVVVLLL